MLANYWQGEFPWQNLELDGFSRTAPVGSFPPNDYGLLDMIVVNRWDKAQLWRNLGAPGTGHWLQLRLAQPGANRDAIGAWVEVDRAGSIDRQELTIGGGHASGNLGWMHFGLGAATRAKVRVQWPHGDWSAWHEVGADAFWIVDRERGAIAWKAPS